MKIRLFSLITASLVGCGILVVTAAATTPVTLQEVDEVIPTYLSGPPDPNPMFYFGRNSQGAEGRIYPYPLYDNLTQEKADRTYHLVYLENEYVKIGILPEIGGRLFSALDKTNNYDFIYRQHVIKPALIGLTGSWISGGIEWNIPHHHRASTFLPVQYRVEENADGSKTVWVGELEIRHRMRWAVGYTLRPGSAVLECAVRIVNRTPLVNTMLCFANVAVNTNVNYQIIFPPSTQWVTHHLKREFTQWPIARQPYGGVNWKGEDVSWYKNHVNANSMFAWNYQDDFFAGYDHGKQAGIMSIADHHIVPGKKFWTWGNGPRGQMWDEILTDKDGPYIELMVGAYSDNQPDYSWLQPFETRAFEMYWYPFRNIGGVKQANLDAAVNLEVKDGMASFGFHATREFSAATVRLTAGDKVLLEERITIDPAHPFAKQLALPAGLDEHDVRASLWADGRELVGYAPLRLPAMAQPEVVTPPPAPADFKDDEELFLAGQRIDQFHDPIRDPDPYWAELLKRDPGDTSANIGVGLLDLRRARYVAAEQHFRLALDRLTAKHTTPKNAEPLYYLGVALKAQGKNDDAFDAFYRAAWSQEWKAPAYFSLAEIASGRGDFPSALRFVESSLDANALNVRAYGLKAALLRHLGRTSAAQETLALALKKTDPLDVRLLAETWFAHGAQPSTGGLSAVLARFPDAGLETAIEYANAGLNDDASAVLDALIAVSPGKEKGRALACYWRAHLAEKGGDAGKAAAFRRAAAEASPDYVFPFQSETIAVLARALEVNPRDARAAYYLGNLLFDAQPAEAVALWERAVAADPTAAVAWRNLAQAYGHEQREDAAAKAVAALEKAVGLNPDDPTNFVELDQFYQTAGAPVEKRLALLRAHESTLLKKDEGIARLIALEIVAGDPDAAIGWLKGRKFSVWEGGSRFNTGEAWTDAHLVRGLHRLQMKQYAEALADFRAALTSPANLRASEPHLGSRVPEINTWIGVANQALGDTAAAQRAWNEALQVEAPIPQRRSGALFLPRSVQRFHQARAAQKLGRTDFAAAEFRELVSAGTAALDAPIDPVDAELPAPSRPSPRTRQAAAHYVAGLGYAGLGEKAKALQEFDAVLALIPDHLGARIARSQL